MSDNRESNPEPSNVPYRVLARTYRPQTFEALIGQEAMVRTLGNAIAAGRLAHAFILTGVRGVGKTTTARLIARALNCIGPDGNGGPTTSPCGQCDPCTAIAASRHVDVIEMDAASRTGVDDIREIIDGVHYAPVSARYKIYIIDEVHMLSKNAFNALLKTLEEPPAHVKFLFATTEIRKLPVTVLSRCQRFDLKRVDAQAMIAHLKGICEKESAEADETALAMIARASEGSVRDALSLLDQAIAHGGGAVRLDDVRDMLGLADRARVLDLTKAVMAGELPEALTILRGQYDLGADPAVVLGDMLDLIHWLTRLKVMPEAGETSAPEAERHQGAEMAQSLAMPHLTRAWQMLLKGLDEVRRAPSPIAAAEMVLIRLAYAADLPSPADVIRALQKNDTKSTDAAPSSGQTSAPSSAPSSENQPQSARILALRPDHQGAGTAAGSPPQQMPPQKMQPRHAPPKDFAALVRLFHAEKEGVLATTLKDQVRLVDYRPGRLTINVSDKAPPDLARRVQSCLLAWTEMAWQVVISNEDGAPSLRDNELEQQKRQHENALADPLVSAVLTQFPGARIVDIRPPHRIEPSLDEPPEGDGFDPSDGLFPDAGSSDDLLFQGPSLKGKEKNA
ncbi:MULTISPECIES: DNA polymerase III subunit gamma/tau [unclassified Iodidimonas]|jgi:DNA polymerase-3 subunit gamma/tau|uniref:DNA polymerase III subunit gamma/tau n=1 Tax=unclassified Iodidimonas TaxID=2626145 RepID=UPI0024828747|nr:MULTISPECIES: DNA polymerase III subunit gamma/tau [unclassified Iodidimonas]